jgi:hypothetical protein
MGAAFQSQADRLATADPMSHTPILSILPCGHAQGLPLGVSLSTLDYHRGTPTGVRFELESASTLPRACTFGAPITTQLKPRLNSARTAPSRVSERSFLLATRDWSRVSNHHKSDGRPPSSATTAQIGQPAGSSQVQWRTDNPVRPPEGAPRRPALARIHVGSAACGQSFCFLSQRKPEALTPASATTGASLGSQLGARASVFCPRRSQKL